MPETNFKERFDAKAKSLVTAINAMPGSLGDVLPGLNRERVRRVIQDLSRLLGRLDRTGAKHPELLVYGTTNAAEYLITILDSVQQTTSSGAQHFVQNGLNQLTELQWRLERAVGVDADIARQMRVGQVSEFQLVLDEVQKILTAVDHSKQVASSYISEVERSKALMDQRLSDAGQATEKIAAIREQAERLATGGSRGRESLDKIIKIARDKAAQIENAVADIERSRQAAAQSSGHVDEQLNRITGEADKLEKIASRANQILTGATQAGLAGSYISERDILRSRQDRYAIVFYSLIALTIAYAVVFIIPAIDQLALKRVSLEQGILLLLLRATIFLPLGWAIMFTSRQHGRLDLIQMDYSAKATTSLAYSGYRGEVEHNDGMLERLQQSLINRFSEHPERLVISDRQKAESPKRRSIIPSKDVQTELGTERAGENQPAE